MPTLEWMGKAKVINHHQDVPYRVLDRVYSYDETGQHEDDNGSPNMIIHGDNLEALKSLLPKYEGRIDVVYIDPPYNTGNEGWIYNDNVKDPRILKWIGDVVGKEGEDFTRHDKWLCMMYPRLKLLQKLLAPEGMIFISIDDNEQAFLKLICDEIFGIRNFLADVIWEKSDSPRMDAKLFSTRHDHTIVYSKNIDEVQLQRVTTEEVPAHYNKVDESGNRYYTKPLRYMGQADSREDRPNLYYAITAPDGNAVYPVKTDGTDGRWRWSQEKVDANTDLIEWVSGKKGWVPYYKIYASDVSMLPPETIWYNKDVGSNRTSIAQLKAIFSDNKSFDTPKPIGLIERMLEISGSKDALVLDSFAGSGTTAHAVLNANKADGGNRQFILVELMDYADDVTAERMKRVIDGYGEGKKAVEGTGGSFSYYELGVPIFIDGNLNPEAPLEAIREYVWYSETASDYIPSESWNTYYLGEKNGIVYYFCYEPDKAVALNGELLSTIDVYADRYVIYADTCEMSQEALDNYHIVFKKIPRDITRF